MRPDITSYEDIRGKRLAVDAVATGFSFILRHMLEQHGIKNGDYTYVRARRSTERRLEALAEDRAAARRHFAISTSAFSRERPALQSLQPILPRAKK
jgi:TRAP-type uncharacterized transport system substrate-binding protein